LSYSAQGWAQRQVFGSPILKGVMQALCYLMRDDELTVYAAVVNPPDKVSLEKLTEYEERAIRKALRDLADLGFLQDTGERRRNMVVWRLPRYEAWLARAEQTTPPQDGRGQLSEPSAAPQASDSTLEKTADDVSDNDPSRLREGFPRGTATPPVHWSDPSRPGVTTPPVQGRESSLDLGSTKPARVAIRIEDWKQQARVRQDRAPERATKDTPPGTALKAHFRFWRRMVDWYGHLWLVQWGQWPSNEWIRLLNLWNDSGKWAELDRLLEDMTLDRPEKVPLLGQIEDLFRAASKAKPKFDESAASDYWSRFASAELEALANARLGLFRPNLLPVAKLPQRMQYVLVPVCRELVAWAISEERKFPDARRRIERAISDRFQLELREFDQQVGAA
jgi:hypothetical protein